MRAAGDAADDSSLSDALQRVRLENHAHGVRFTPSARREASHAVDTVTSSSRPSELHSPEHGSVNPNPSHEHYEHGTHLRFQGMEDSNVSEDSPTVLDDPAMESNSDSDYAPSQSDDINPTRQDNEAENDEKQDEEGEENTAAEFIEEHTDLEYQISEDSLRAAMQASPNTRASFWSANLYRGPEDQSLSVHYCKTLEVAERVVQHFLKERVLGFDIEWRPFSSILSIKRNASLIQIACEDRIALFHISLFHGSTIEKLMPPTLKTILESPEILKVGVAVKGDFSRLQRYLGIEAQGVFELSRLHNVVELHATEPGKKSNKLVSLAKQVHQHLQLPLYKGGSLADDPDVQSSVRESDWSEPLDLNQIHYAASDAYAGFRLYHILEWKRKQLRPTPPTHGLCDYDSKPKPKPKEPGAKKAPRKRKAVIKDATEEVIVDPEQKLEEGEEEEEDGYETAPEELPYSHKLDDTSEANPEPTDVPSLNEGPTQRRVGRVNLSWLRGPDPGYPSLPGEPGKDYVQSAALDAEQDSNGADLGLQNVLSTANVNHSSPLGAGEEEDEFADPELYEALQIMDLDIEGRPKEVPTPTTEATKRSDQEIAARPKDSSNDVEMSEYTLPEVDENTTSLRSVASAVPNDAQPISPEYTQATNWAKEYLQATIPSPMSATPSRIRATVPHLRAYHMWHVQRLSIDESARHLRDPPLTHTTVTGYILQAVQHEQLDVDVEATRNLIRNVPKANVLARFRRVAEMVDYFD